MSCLPRPVLPLLLGRTLGTEGSGIESSLDLNDKKTTNVQMQQI